MSSENRFKYNQLILVETAYVEALALYCYCKFNCLDFDSEIVKRKKEDLNKFPDFIINSRFLEVVRALDTVHGKQQKDIASMFGNKDSKQQQLVAKKNAELAKYKGKNSHHIEFKAMNGVTCAFPDLRDYQSFIDEIKNAIVGKYESYKSRIINNELDLFVVSYNCIDDESIKEIHCWYKNNENFTSMFANVYIFYLSSDNPSPNCVAKLDKEKYEIRPVDYGVDKNKLAETIIKLGWVDGKKFLK